MTSCRSKALVKTDVYVDTFQRNLVCFKHCIYSKLHVMKNCNTCRCSLKEQKLIKQGCTNFSDIFGSLIKIREASRATWRKFNTDGQQIFVETKYINYSPRLIGSRDLCTLVVKNACSTGVLPVKPIIRVAWIRKRVVTAEVIAGTGILEWKREKNMRIR